GGGVVGRRGGLVVVEVPGVIRRAAGVVARGRGLRHGRALHVLVAAGQPVLLVPDHLPPRLRLLVAADLVAVRVVLEGVDAQRVRRVRLRAGVGVGVVVGGLALGNGVAAADELVDLVLAGDVVDRVVGRVHAVRVGPRRARLVGPVSVGELVQVVVPEVLRARPADLHADIRAGRRDGVVDDRRDVADVVVAVVEV